MSVSRSALLLLLLAVGGMGEARADELYTVTPTPSAAAISEGRSWTKWHFVKAGESVSIAVTGPSDVAVEVRAFAASQDYLSKAAPKVRFGLAASPGESALSTVLSTSQVYKSKWRVGEPVSLRESSDGAASWNLAAGATPIAFRVTVTPRPVEIDAGAALAGPAVGEPERFAVGLNAGYLYGIGDVRSPQATLRLGYLLPVLDDALAVTFGAGWYSGSELERRTDPLIGNFENEWHLMAIPLNLNVEYWLPLEPMFLVGGAGLEYVVARFTFESRSELGTIDPEDVTTGAAIGTRLYGGLRWPLGPGHLTGVVNWSSSNIRNDFSEFTGDMGGISLLVGYEFML